MLKHFTLSQLQDLKHNFNSNADIAHMVGSQMQQRMEKEPALATPEEFYKLGIQVGRGRAYVEARNEINRLIKTLEKE